MIIMDPVQREGVQRTFAFEKQLGALLLQQQGGYAENEAVYIEDLRRHPKNPWALHGLIESLTKQEKKREARQLVDTSENACQRADVTINRSCFCRLKVNEGAQP